MYLVLFLLLSGFVQAQAAQISTNNTAKYIGEEISFFSDPSHAIKFEEIQKKYRDGEFIRNNDNVFHSPSTSDAIWLNFELKAQQSEMVWLHLENSIIDSIELYQLDDSGVLTNTFFKGDVHPERDLYKDGFTFWFPIIHPNDTTTYQFFMKIVSSGMMEVPLLIGNESDLMHHHRINEYHSLIFIGAMLVIFIYNLMIFFFTKDRIYLIYTIYLATILLGTTFLHNFPLIEMLVGNVITYQYTYIWLIQSFIMVGIFFLNYFDLKKTYPILRKIVIIEMCAILFFAILNLFIPVSELTLYYEFISVIYFSTCLSISYYLWAKGNNKAPLYAIGWSFMIISSGFYLLVVNGMIPYTIFTRNIMYYGVTLEVVIFSIALAQRINRMRNEEVALNNELKNSNYQLIRKNEQLDTFNYHVSHELKTVINNSYALTKMVLKYADQPDRVNEIGKKLLYITENGAETVLGFLKLGEIDYVFKKEELEEILIQNEIHSILEKNDLKDKIIIEFASPENASIKMHTEAFNILFLNLITNTIKYSEAQPSGKVTYYKNPNDLTIIYQDTGIGMDLQEIGDRLFAPFQRFEIDENVDGTGLGMYIIHQIVTKYQGEIKLESEKGKGVKFIFKFPLNNSEKL